MKSSHTKLLKELDDYFEGANLKLVLELVDDKMCKLIRKPEPHPQTSKIRTSEEKIPMGHGAFQQLAHENPSPALSDKDQAAVVTLFANLQYAHKYSAKVAKAVAQLRTITTPEQFQFIMKRAVHPLIQLQIPPKLESPANWHFAKERLTEEEALEDPGVNEMLP